MTQDAMIAEAARRTAGRSFGREALVIQDTTVIRSTGGGGYPHAVVALDAADGGILGLVDGLLLSRDEGRKGQRRALPIEETESFRWLEGADRAASVCARLGGWTGYFGKPGPAILLQGWLEIQAAKRGIAALGNKHDL